MPTTATTETAALREMLDELLLAGWGVRNAGRESRRHDDAWQAAAAKAAAMLEPAEG